MKINYSKKPIDTKKTILVIEDEKSMREVLATLSEMKGYVVVTAYDGKNGWDIYKKNKPDLIITDLKMPGMSGFDLLKKIREKDNLTPVILVTAFGTTDSAIEAFKLGANDYIMKPFHIEELVHSIKVNLEGRLNKEELFRIKKLNDYLLKENERLKKNISNKSIRTPDRYRNIMAATIHSMKREFMHIGFTIKSLREQSIGSRDVQEEYELIERSLQYSQLLLRRLFDFLDFGKTTLEKVDILDVLQRTISIVRPRLPSKIHLEITTEKSVRGKRVFGNIEQLMEVLIELIQNAIDALYEKGGIIELRLEGRNNKIALSVRDNGPGISKKIREELFKKEVKSKRGLGLGLFLCSKVISELGGKLYLEDASEKGSIFTILLPKVNNGIGS